jgi:hypothetical protein
MAGFLARLLAGFAEPGEIAAREPIAGCGCSPVVKVAGEAERVKGPRGCSG